MVKLTLKKMLKNHIENYNERGYKTKLALIAGYSQPGGLTKVLDKEEKEFENFLGLINLVRHIWDHNESPKIMAQYSEEIHPNRMTARNLLECLVSCREFEAFNNLLDKMDSCTNDESKEWSKIYRMQYKYELAREQEEYKSLLIEIGSINLTQYELKVYQKMLLNYCHNQLRNFDMVKYLSNQINEEVQLIENDYIKEMYTIRANEIMSYNYLMVYNNPEAARECAEKIINSSARVAYKAYAYFIIGKSYMFSSYEKTVSNLYKSIELYEQLGRKYDVQDLKEQVELVKIYWDKQDNDKCFTVFNYLLLKVKQGEEITNQLKNEKDKIGSEFYLYLEGLNTKNNKKLLLSLIKFIKKNDLFLANLAKIELFKNGYDEDIINELVSINEA